jgi:hypothetical protein
LSVDTPRAVEYYVPSESQRKMNLADKYDTRARDADATASASGQAGTAQHRVLKRFTMLSKSVLYEQAYGGIKGKKNAKGAKHASSSSSSSHQNEGGDGSNLQHIAREVSPIADNMFTCPILSALIRSKFFILWWDITTQASTIGICNAILSPTSTGKLAQYSNVITDATLHIPLTIRKSDLKPNQHQSASISISASFKHTSMMKIVSDVSSLGILGSYSGGVNVFDKTDFFSTRRVRSVVARRMTAIALDEKKAFTAPR